MLVQDDIRDSAAIGAALRSGGGTAVLHFAGLKSVGESVQKPLADYENNFLCSLDLLQVL
jgi:UDP-glucose 4-epimerase